MLSLLSPLCINLATVFPTLLCLGWCYALAEHHRTLVRQWQRRNPNPGWAGCCLLLPLTLQSFFRLMDTCTSHVLPVFKVVSENPMDVFSIALPPSVSLCLSC